MAQVWLSNAGVATHGAWRQQNTLIVLEQTDSPGLVVQDVIVGPFLQYVKLHVNSSQGSERNELERTNCLAIEIGIRCALSRLGMILMNWSGTN